MGFFSWNCPLCGHSVMSPYIDEEQWRNDAVLLKDNGTVIIGRYDGYGRIQTSYDRVFEVDSFGAPKIMHNRCWSSAGKPSYEECSASPRAGGQGYFYDDGDNPELKEEEE